MKKKEDELRTKEVALDEREKRIAEREKDLEAREKLSSREPIRYFPQSLPVTFFRRLASNTVINTGNAIVIPSFVSNSNTNTSLDSEYEKSFFESEVDKENIYFGRVKIS